MNMQQIFFNQPEPTNAHTSRRIRTPSRAVLLQSSKPEMGTATAQEQDEHVEGFEPPSRAILQQSSKTKMDTTTAQEQDEHAGGFEHPSRTVLL
jgi:hypothetical protein